MANQHPWEREAENWLKWARTRGFDAYWYYRDSFFHDMVPQPGSRTLELGCGEGRVARDLAARGHNVVAVDLTFTLLQHAREADPSLSYACADAAALPFDDESFDLVVAYNSLMDVQDMAGTVREAARVLTSDACLCACVVHPMRDAGHFTGHEPDADFVISGTYYGPRPVKDTFEREGLTMTFEGWSYSLQDYFGALESAGLTVGRLKEPLPSPGARAKHPSWETSMRIPMFLFLRASKR
jgi:SAM-dependent methyltransferase